MHIEGSKRVKSLAAYAMATVREKVGALRAAGHQPVDFGMGDPSWPTPEVVRRTCQEAIEKHAASGYPPFAGMQEYRQAVVDWNQRRFGIALDADSEVVSSVGSKESIFHFAEAFLDPGDIAICPDPGYPPYSRGTVFAEGVVHPAPVVGRHDFLPDLDAIPDEVAEKARIFWLTHPAAPSGKVAPPEYLEGWVAWCQERDIIACSDEAYSEIYFGDPPRSALEFGRDGVVVFNSLSKRSAMTGYRVGWVAGDARAIDLFMRVKTNIDTGTPYFIQEAAIAALADESHVEMMRAEYRRRRDLFVGAFKSAGLPASEPEATIYQWQKAPPGVSSVQLAEALLDPAILAVTIPSVALVGDLAAQGEGEEYVRLAMVPTWGECERVAAAIADGLRF